MTRLETKTYLLLKYGSMNNVLAHWLNHDRDDLGDDYVIIKDFLGYYLNKQVDIQD